MSRRDSRWSLAPKLIILAFLLRGAFYCAEQPIWEGFDEWAHFAYIQHFAEYGRPPSRTDTISDELGMALRLAPVSSSAAEYSRDSLTHDSFWRLSPEERRSRERQLDNLRPQFTGRGAGSPALKQYEAQQPPLYYLLLAPVYIALKSFSLPAQVFALRFVSLAMSAAGIWFCYRIALQTPQSHRAATAVLLLLCSWPGFLVNSSRIANDALAQMLGSAYILCLFALFRRQAGWRDWMRSGAILGAALLAKSYMLAFVPLLPAVVLIESMRRRQRFSSLARGLVVAFLFTGSIAGWWYARNYASTGTLSGEQIDIAAAGFGLHGKIAAVTKIHWLTVVDSAAMTHIWTGGWSFLAIRSWMYRMFEWLAAAAGAGVVAMSARLFRRASRRMLSIGDARFVIAVSAYLLFCTGLAYFTIAVYLTRGISTSLGWYLNTVAGIEAVLLAAGFTRLAGSRLAGGLVAATAALACIFDLYTVHFVSLPYYTGLIAHLPSGAVGSFHPVSALREVGVIGMLARLAVNKPVGMSGMAALWMSYLVATFGLLGLSVRIVKRTFFARE